MNKLWHYQDYVRHLSHQNRLVRSRAFDALEISYANRYTDEVSKLIGDEDEHLACAAPKYLSKHEAVQHAPTILDSFKNGRGNIPSNCALALADLRYEPAADVMFEYFSVTKSANTFLGILNYLGKIHREDCRDALKAAVIQIQDEFILGSAVANLLQHHNPEDVTLVLDRYFGAGNQDQHYDPVLRNVSYSLGGSEYFRDLTEFAQNNILEKPNEVIDLFMRRNPIIELDLGLRESMIGTLKNRQYQDFSTMIMFDARSIFNERYPEGSPPTWLNELFGQDMLCLTLLEELTKRPSVWKRIKDTKELGENLVPLIISGYFSIKEREAYTKALSPEAGVEKIIYALKNSGSGLPAPIQKKIKELVLISELKMAFTEDLMTWGDIWTVRLMGRIGNKEFIPDLIRVLAKSDSMDYIYSDAIKAINALDESADEIIIKAIMNHELGDWESFAILEHLPYAEAYDFAVQKWENGDDNDMDSYEVFACCLNGIGDPRGIKKIQKIYADENDATYIGDALECLSVIHNVDIPELPDIHKRRKDQEERQKAREKELNQLAREYRKEKGEGTLRNSASIVPFKRQTPKIGRNEPCPCGSGKKYKKCCLNN